MKCEAARIQWPEAHSAGRPLSPAPLARGVMRVCGRPTDPGESYCRACKSDLKRLEKSAGIKVMG